MSENPLEKKLQTLVETAVSKYESDVAKNAVIDAVRSRIAYAKSQNKEIGEERPEGGYSLKDIVDHATNQVDQLIKPPAPKDEPKKDEPVKDEPTKDEPTKDEPKDEPKKDEPKDDKVLPSGARVPDGIKPSEVTQVDVTNPVTLGDVKKIVAARQALKIKQQTSKQQSQTRDALDDIIREINSKKEDE